MKTKITYSAILLVVSLGLFLGFNVGEGIYGTKSNNNTISTKYVSQTYTVKNATVYSDDFDGDNTVAGLQARGYKAINNSVPVGTTSWFQGNPAAFVAFNGPTSGYVGANFNNTTGGTGIIDTWLIFPRVVGGIVAGDSLTFWSRSSDAGVNYPDSIRVMYSAAGDSAVAGTWVELGRYKVVNPTAGAPNNGYELRGFRAGTSGANGRFAIVYHVNGAGPAGNNSDYIGIDAARIQRTVTPPPNPTTWWEQTTPVATTLYTVSAADINNVWIGGAAGKVLRTTNGGTWALASGNLPPSDAIYAIWAFDANSCLVTTSPGATFTWKTTNGGTNWTQVFTQVGGFIDGFYFKDANNGLMMGDAVGGRSSIWKTTNAGTTWDSAGVNFATSDASWNNAMCGVGDVVYWGTNASKIYKSTNFGTNWAPSAATGEANSEAIWFNDIANGMYGGNTLVQLTSNGGANWTTVTPTGTVAAIGGITGTGTSNYWLVRGANVYATTNAGANWTNPVTTGGTFTHITKSRSGSPYLYAVRSNGTVAKYGGPATGINPINNGLVDNYSLGQNYPNPFNPTTKITFAVPTTGLVTLKVYDMVGKEIATLVNAQMNSGSYSVDFTASSLSSGIYFYTIKSGNFTDTKKMMLIK
ncbi:hypothetical protein BH10BAC5_BH10BAC5_11850 [soil metagenome]